MDSVARVPKFVAVASDLEAKINSGMYPRDSYLPSESELEQMYEVSRTTVRAAIARLREAGLVTVIHGKGTKVSPPRVLSQPNLVGFTEHCQACGVVPGTKVLYVQRVRAEREVARALGVADGAEVVKVTRLHTANGEAVDLAVSYLRAPWDVDKDELESVVSLYRYLATRYGLTVTSVDDLVYAEPARSPVVGLLEIRRGEPVLVQDRIAYGQDNQPIEYSRTFARAENLRIRIKRDVRHSTASSVSHEVVGR